MNAAKWNSLTPEQQGVVQAAATKAATEIANKAWERSDGFVQKMRDKGYEIVEFSQEERDVIKSAVTEAVWPTVSDVSGQDLLDRTLANDG